MPSSDREKKNSKESQAVKKQRKLFCASDKNQEDEVRGRINSDFY